MSIETQATATSDIPAGPMSVEQAALALADDRKQERPRSADGKFTPQAKGEVIEDPVKVVDLAGKPLEAKTEEAPAEDDDPEFELPPEEEGKDPIRVKLSDMFAGYQEAAKLKSEVEQLRTQTAAIPEEYTTAIQQTIQERSKYLDGLDVLGKIIAPKMPNARDFQGNPEGYFEAMARYELDKSQADAVKAERDRLAERQYKENEQIERAFVARAEADLKRGWPEFVGNEAVQRQAAEGLMKHYGFSKDEVKQIIDPRLLFLARDALALRSEKAKQAEAVKVVRAKPKMVRGSAPVTTNTNAAKFEGSMRELTATGSVDAAVAALRGLKL